MEKEKKIIHFTTDHNLSYEDYKENCEANEVTPGEDGSNDFWDWVNETETTYQQDELGFLKEKGLLGDGNERYLVKGMVGTWRGPYEGGVIKTIEDTIRTLAENEDFIEVKTTDDETVINTSNHDASSWFKVWKLSKRAIAYIDNHADMDRKELHDKLLATEGWAKPITYVMTEKIYQQEV